MGKTVLIVHGGVGPKKGAAEIRLQREGIERALADGRRLLEKGAVEAAAAAVRVLEDDPVFNAGTGSVLQADGEARLSASVMDGRARRFAAVSNVTGLLNPVLVAKALLLERHRVLSGRGAREWALAHGFEPGDPRTEEEKAKLRRVLDMGADTVGACALDGSGALASATSTGGLRGAVPGRMSDSGTPAGNYASPLAAVSTTGIGEEITDECLAARVVFGVESGLPLAEALARALDEAAARRRKMAAIALAASGNIAFGATSGVLAWGWTDGARTELFQGD